MGIPDASATSRSRALTVVWKAAFIGGSELAFNGAGTRALLDRTLTSSIGVRPVAAHRFVPNG